MDERKGSQTPTRSVVLPYSHTLGKDAIDLYNSSGRTAMPWQELQTYDILAVDDDGLYVHQKYGYELPRRNGKGDVLIIRELYGLKNGEKIMHTAHLATTAHSAWERLYERVIKAGLVIESEYRALGKEHIFIEGGGRIEFRTRTSKGGIGEGYDLLVIDEAQEYRPDQEAALKYVVTDSANPQTILCGTPPTPESSGTVFRDFRKDVLSGGREYSGWAEWSVYDLRKPLDREAWYETNPSLGYVLKERTILSEIGSDELDHNIQRLGYWFSYNLKSAISEAEWNVLCVDRLPQLKWPLFVGIKFGPDGANVALSIAVRTVDDQIFVESYDCRPLRDGNEWILRFLQRADIKVAVIDGQSGQGALVDEIEKAKIRTKKILPKTSEVITANATFEQALFAGSIAHCDQPALTQAVSNCEHRSIGTSGGFGYRSIKPGVEIALLESVSLAVWACNESKEKRKPRISY